MNSRPKPGILEIPAQSKPTRDSIKTRPKDVNAWIAELPKADFSQYGRRIYENLRELNGLDISKKDRQYILQALVKPVHETSVFFQRHFVTDALPLSSKNQALAEAAIALNLQMALGYKILFANASKQKPGFLTRKPLVDIIYTAILYLSKVLLISYQVYNDHPPNTWTDLHKFFLWAEEHALLHIKISPRAGQKSAQTIDQLYKQVLLLALVSPFRLRQRAIEKVFNASLNWVQYCNFLPADAFDKDADHVLIRMNSDSTPGYYLSEKAYQRLQTRVLDTGPLVHLLREQILHQAAAQNDIAIIDIPSETMNLLVLTWGGHAKRAFARTEAPVPLNVSIGINASHQLLKTLKRETEEAKQESTQEVEEPQHLKLADTVELQRKSSEKETTPLELSLELVENDNAKNFNISVYTAGGQDVWNPAYTGKTIGYDNNIRDWLEKKQRENDPDGHIPPPYNFNNINESATGYCMSTKVRYEQHTGKMQIGEITGIHSPDGKRDNVVAIGVIRRIKQFDASLMLGIQKLAPFASAVEISNYHPQISLRKFVRGLMLPAIKSSNQPITLLTQQPYKVGDQVVIKKNLHQTLVSLTKQLEYTGVVSQFEFTIEKDLGKDVDENDTAANAAKFESVWSLI